MRQLTHLERALCHVDTILRSIIPPQERLNKRSNPGIAHPETHLTSQQKRHVAGLMRVNHAGEICAQALYQGQASTAKLSSVKQQMHEAAEEEIDHLAWCEQRLNELDSKTSMLNPIWYAGSFILGAMAGLAGDQWSLGFVAETERQVSAHLQKHLDKLPADDLKTHAILTQMHSDELQHADMAIKSGGAELPFIINQLMQGMSKLLTTSSYYI